MSDSLYEMKVLSTDINRKEEQELRRLWKETFKENEAYLDFYHSFNLGNNRIWTLWDGERLISMLHANPYRISVEGTLYDSYFIVGAATDERYRRRGCMGRLMKTALKTFQKEGVEFVYLLPVKEEYYLPFGFQTVGTQRTWMRPVKKGEAVVWTADQDEQMLPGFLGLPGSEGADAGHRLTGTLALPIKKELPAVAEGVPAVSGGRPAKLSDKLPAVRDELPEEQQAWMTMAAFANHWLSGRANSFTYRDAVYYRRRSEESRAMNGGLYLLREDDRLAGVASMVQKKGNWLLYDAVGDELLAALEESDEWKPVPSPQKIMVKWLGDGESLGQFLPFIMEELT